MPIQGTRQDTWDVTVRVQDVTNKNKPMVNLGTWDKKSGGQIDSDELKYKPGGMAAPISLGGSKNVDSVVVSRNYRLVRDHQELMERLMAGVGTADMEVHQMPLDQNKNDFGPPIIWRGTLKRCTPPDVDSESTDAAMIELEMTVDGFPTVG